MDNKKIGKLIADLRKRKGLTQQDLGDKVGVGFRAVSKWERGLTLPDIANINELSKILGITSDELLSGELNKENKNKDKKMFSPIVIKIMIAVIFLITIIGLIFVYYNNKTYVYSMINASDDYYVEGQLTFQGDNICIMINKINFKDPRFSSIIIKNYEYEINSGEDYIVRYGYIYMPSGIEEPISIKDFMKKITINYNGKINKTRTEMIRDDIVIDFIFLDEFDNEITKKVNISINKLDKK